MENTPMNSAFVRMCITCIALLFCTKTTNKDEKEDKSLF